MIKALIFLGIGLFGGVWISWPGITDKNNWQCVHEVLINSKEENTQIRKLMAVSPKLILKKENKSLLTKLRFVGDTCFR